MGSALTKAFFSGDKPEVPPFESVNLEQEQLAAIGQNRQALPSIFQLGSKVNAYNIDEILKSLEKMLPGYSAIRDSITGTLQSQLRGEIPEDVVREVGRTTAELSRAGGYSGSEAARNLTARDLGLTSYTITNRAIDSASRWMAQARSSTPIFDVTSMFISPSQRINVKLQENQMKWQRDWLANQIDALPEPWEAALGEFFDSIEEMGSSVLSMYAGGAMGGGGGGMGGTRTASGGVGGVNTSAKNAPNGYYIPYME